MKTALLILCAMSFTAFAKPNPDQVKALVEAQPTCDNFVKYDDTNLYLGFGAYRFSLEEPRRPLPSVLRVVPFDQSAAFELATEDSTLDVTAEGDSLFVLTYSGIEEWSLKTRTRVGVYPAYQIDRPLAYKEHATAFARVGGTLVIAHGRLGVSFFDLKTRKVTKQIKLAADQYPHESMATGITVWGDTAYVVMDNFTLGEYNGKFAFRGVILIDVPSQTVQKELEGLDPGADAIVTDGKVLIVSYGGNPVWKFSLKTLGGSKMPRPSGYLRGYPINGHPTRLPFMDEKNYYTCFFKRPEHGGEWPKVPAALDREQLLIK